MSSDLPLCLFGAGGHGRVVASQIKTILGQSVIIADTRKDVPGLTIAYHDLNDIVGHAVLITIGDNAIRQKLQTNTTARIAPALNCSPMQVFTDTLGEGSQIMCGAIINTGAQIGRGVIVNSAAVVEHDAQVSDFCHLAPGSITGAGVRIGTGVFVGTGATILPGIRIAAGSVIGAGAVVTKDITDRGVYLGVPARLVP